MRARGVFFWIAAAAVLGGCGEKSDCSVLFDAIDPRLSEITKLQSPQPSVEQIRNTAGAYRKLAADLDSTKLVGARSNTAAQYRSTAIELAKRFEDLAAAAEAGDEGQATAAKKNIQKAEQEERKILDSISRICRY